MSEMVITIPCIIVICYVVGIAAKAIPAVSDNLIPVIVSVAGGILGVVGMFTISDFPAKDVLNAVAIGIASGLASTGANQIVKQLKNMIPEKETEYIYPDEEDD